MLNEMSISLTWNCYILYIIYFKCFIFRVYIVVTVLVLVDKYVFVVVIVDEMNTVGIYAT